MSLKFKLYFKPTNDPMIYWGPVIHELKKQGFVAVPSYATNIEESFMTKVIQTDAPSENVLNVIMNRPSINRDLSLKSLEEEIC